MSDKTIREQTIDLFRTINMGLETKNYPIKSLGELQIFSNLNEMLSYYLENAINRYNITKPSTYDHVFDLIDEVDDYIRDEFKNKNNQLKSNITTYLESQRVFNQDKTTHKIIGDYLLDVYNHVDLLLKHKVDPNHMFMINKNNVVANNDEIKSLLSHKIKDYSKKENFKDLEFLIKEHLMKRLDKIHGFNELKR